MKLKTLIPFCLLAAAIPPLLSFPDGPYPRLTGGFGEGTCTGCHKSFPLNRGRTLGGAFFLVGIPARYQKGGRYPVKAVLSQPGQRRWGFELSVRFASSGAQAGSLRPVNDQTQVRKARGIEYIEQTERGNRDGRRDGPVEFPLLWIAPDRDQEAVLFNAAGNAANGDGDTSGDYIYTAGGYSSGSRPESELLPVAAARERPASKRLFDDPRVAHIGAPVDLKRGDVQILIQHRFLGPVRNAEDAFGIDFGANINLEMGYAVSDRLSLSLARARFDRLVGLAATLELQTDPASFWRLSLRGGVDGQNNFRDRFSPFLELQTQLDTDRLRTHLSPILVLNSRPDGINRSRAVSGDDNFTLALGIGADLALTRRLSLVGEYVPRLTGYGGQGNERSTVSGGIKIRTWGHVFHLLFTNSRFMSPSQYAVNAGTTDIALGFNIYRRVGR